MLGIRVAGTNHHLPNASLYNRGGARPGAPRGRTGLERHVKGGVFWHWPFEIAEAFDFGMGQPGASMVAFRDNFSVNHQDRPDCGIGACVAESSDCLAEGGVYEDFVIRRFSHKQRDILPPSLRQLQRTMRRPEANRISHFVSHIQRIEAAGSGTFSF
jgi:hypothetical protein